jgi:hypothetical protein
MIKNLLLKPLSGGVLYLVLSVSLVIAITLSMIILLRYYSSMVDVKNAVALKLIRNLESGWEYAKANESAWTPEYIGIDLFGGGSDTIVIHSRPWGVYHAVALEARSGNSSESQSALLGNHWLKSHRYAIRLRNSANSKLKVMGNTVITGDVMVPSSVVIPTFYNGKPFQGNKVVDGNVHEADHALPLLDDRWVAYVRDLLRKDFTTLTDYANGDNVSVNSFLAPTKIITREELIDLKSDLKNNIIVHSSVAISVTSNVSLDGVLLVAPIITIGDSIHGRFQAIASKKIVVGSGVQLMHPSALVVIEDDGTGSISIGKSIIQGSVIIVSDKDLTKPELKIQEGAHIIGEIFVQGDVQLYGNVTGSVACDRFVFNKGGEVRENTLWNVTVDGMQFTRAFVFSSIFAEKSITGIACWL